MSDNPGSIALSIAAHLRRLEPGSLAALRRMGDDGEAPAYWRLAARHGELARQPRRWSPIVRALAILTSKGAPEERAELHDATRPLGKALCDGGDPNWPAVFPVHPLLSERRLAQLLAARGSQRSTLLTRAIRALAASKPRDAGIDVADLAWSYITPARPETIAKPYYERLDRAERAAENAKEPSADD